MHIEYSIITPKLLIGRMPCCKDCFDHLEIIGVTHIINSCNEDKYVPHLHTFNTLYPEIKYLWNPEFDDGVTPKSVDWFYKAIDFADTVKDGKLFIHCYEGRNRSPSLAYAILRSHIYNMTPNEAKTILITKRPITNFGLAYANCAEIAINRKSHI